MSTNPDSKRSLKSRKYWSPLRSRVSTALVKSVYEKTKTDLAAYIVSVDQPDQPATVQETRRARINDAIGAALVLFAELAPDDKRRVKAMKTYLRLASIKPEDTVPKGAVIVTDDGTTDDDASSTPADEPAANGFVAPMDFGVELHAAT